MKAETTCGWIPKKMGLLDFRLTDSTEFTDDAAVSAGDTVEVDYVPWYATDTCNALVVTLVG